MDIDTPMQPLVRDGDGTPVFRANAIVVALLEYAASHGQGLAGILGRAPGEDDAPALFGQADWQQFAQLIGYSLEGYLDLCYVDAAARARTQAHARRHRLAPEAPPATPGSPAPDPVDEEWPTVG